MNLSGMMMSELLLLKRMGLRPQWHSRPRPCWQSGEACLAVETVYPPIDMKLHLWAPMPIGRHFSMSYILR